MSVKSFIQLNSRDNVYVALQDLEAGQVISHDGKDLIRSEKQCPAKHKFTIAELANR
jgi:altronate hydrolase